MIKVNHCAGRGPPARKKFDPGDLVENRGFITAILQERWDGDGASMTTGQGSLSRTQFSGLLNYYLEAGVEVLDHFLRELIQSHRVTPRSHLDHHDQGPLAMSRSKEQSSRPHHCVQGAQNNVFGGELYRGTDLQVKWIQLQIGEVLENTRRILFRHGRGRPRGNGIWQINGVWRPRISVTYCVGSRLFETHGLFSEFPFV